MFCLTLLFAVRCYASVKLCCDNFLQPVPGLAILQGLPVPQRWNRVSGSPILAGMGRVTGQCVRPGVWPGFEF